jgi:hypothetical protein
VLDMLDLLLFGGGGGLRGSGSGRRSASEPGGFARGAAPRGNDGVRGVRRRGVPRGVPAERGDAP